MPSRALALYALMEIPPFLLDIKATLIYLFIVLSLHRQKFHQAQISLISRWNIKNNLLVRINYHQTAKTVGTDCYIREFITYALSDLDCRSSKYVQRLKPFFKNWPNHPGRQTPDL